MKYLNIVALNTFLKTQHICACAEGNRVAFITYAVKKIKKEMEKKAQSESNHLLRSYCVITVIHKSKKKKNGIITPYNTTILDVLFSHFTSLFTNIRSKSAVWKMIEKQQ